MANVETRVIREELHALLDHIPDHDVSAAREYLRSLLSPVELALLNAPPDAEPLSEHEASALGEAQRRKQRGEPLISHEDILSGFESSRVQH